MGKDEANRLGMEIGFFVAGDMGDSGKGGGSAQRGHGSMEILLLEVWVRRGGVERHNYVSGEVDSGAVCMLELMQC